MAEAVPSSVSGFGEEDWAVVVGIDHYRCSELHNLEGARDDGKQFIDWLRAKEHGNLCKRDQVIECFSRRDHTVSTLTGIRDTFGKLIGQKDKQAVRMGRRLYIFASAHGAGENVRDSAIYLSEHSTSVTTAFSLSAVAEKFREAGWFDEIVLFMDCCRTHDHTLGPVSEYSLSGLQFGPVADEPSDTYFYCYACKFQRKTEEAHDGRRYRGVFSSRLFRGLKGEAADEHGWITAPSLKTYLQGGQGGTSPDFDHKDSFKSIVFGRQVDVTTSFILELPPGESDFQVLDLSNLAPLPWVRNEIGPGKFRIVRASRINVLVRTPVREKYVQPHESHVVLRGS